MISLPTKSYAKENAAFFAYRFSCEMKTPLSLHKP